MLSCTCIYDREFYFTPEELHVDGIDVQSIVEKPELHIIARSSASLDDQALFNQSRLECIKELSDPLFTTTGISVHDIVRFFHGDGPAQQFDAGNNIGPFVCCTVNADSIFSVCIQMSNKNTNRKATVCHQWQC